MSIDKILKTQNIIKLSSENTLDYALKKLSSSHDAGFVFDEKNNFLGLINPYYCVIQNSFPSNAKVSHCLFKPPKLRINDSIVKTAQLFIETKVHYLPVFNEKDEFIGIISARRLLHQFINDESFKIKIKDFLKFKKNKLITINEQEKINQILPIFKKTKYSKLVVVDFNNKLKGMLSYFDLIYYLMSPREKMHEGFREGRKISFYHMQAKHFMKRYVITLRENDLFSEVINLILEKKIGSVVIIDNFKIPIQIITTKDILKFFIEKEKKKEKPRLIPRFFNLDKVKQNFLKKH